VAKGAFAEYYYWSSPNSRPFRHQNRRKHVEKTKPHVRFFTCSRAQCVLQGLRDKGHNSGRGTKVSLDQGAPERRHLRRFQSQLLSGRTSKPPVCSTENVDMGSGSIGPRITHDYTSMRSFTESNPGQCYDIIATQRQQSSAIRHADALPKIPRENRSLMVGNSKAVRGIIIRSP